MANVTGIFKVTASQYSRLRSQGYIDVGGRRYPYNDNALYLVDADTVSGTFTGTTSQTGPVYSGTSDTIYTLPSLNSGEYYAAVTSFSSGVLTLLDVYITQQAVPGLNHYHSFTPSGTVTVTN